MYQLLSGGLSEILLRVDLAVIKHTTNETHSKLTPSLKTRSQGPLTTPYQASDLCQVDPFGIEAQPNSHAQTGHISGPCDVPRPGEAWCWRLMWLGVMPDAT